jgi:hypothetical protein
MTMYDLHLFWSVLLPSLAVMDPGERVEGLVQRVCVQDVWESKYCRYVG